MFLSRFFGTRIIGLGILGAVTTAKAAIPPNVQAHVRERIDSGQAVGIVVGRVDAAGSEYFGYGLTARTGEKVDENTIMEIGSVTKVFTATLFARSAVAGYVDWNDPVAMYLPAAVKVPSKGARMISLRDLANHHSGLPRMPTNFSPKDEENPYADYTCENMYEFLGEFKLSSEPGSTFEYSNLGSGLLGHALSRTAGKSYEDLILERIAIPLGMMDTRIKLSPDQNRRMAKGHKDGKEVKNWDLGCLEGAGALRSTAKDMIRFLSSSLGLHQSDLDPVLQKTYEDRTDTSHPDMKVALGWHISTMHGTEIIWHNGGTGGYHSFCGFDLKSKTGVVVLTNSAEDIDDIGFHVLEPRNELKPVRKTVSVPSSALDSYVGYYELRPGIVFHVTQEGGNLYAQLTGQERFPVYPESNVKFFYKVADAQLTFVLDADGKVSSLVLHQNAVDQTAKKLGPDYQPPAPKTEVYVDPKDLQKYVGKYQFAPGVLFDVIVDGARLGVQLTGQPRLPVFPESQTQFFYKAVNAQLTFVVEADGTVSSLILHQNGVDRTAKRIP